MKSVGWDLMTSSDARFPWVFYEDSPTALRIFQVLRYLVKLQLDFTLLVLFDNIVSGL